MLSRPRRLRDRYTGRVPQERASLRARQIEQTRLALISAARELFGRQGFASTSVEEVADAAGVTTGALYHHFPTKAALFESVFIDLHSELFQRAAKAASTAPTAKAAVVEGFEAFLDAVLAPDVQRIVITDAPAVLGVSRFTELDEEYAFAAIADGLRRANSNGELQVDDAETAARLLLGALARGAMVIATSKDPIAARAAVAAGLRSLVNGLAN